MDNPLVSQARLGRMIGNATLRLADARLNLSEAYETGDIYCLIPEAEEAVAAAERQVALLQRTFARHFSK